MTQYRYFLVKDGAIADACRSWRKRWEDGRAAANAFASSLGATQARYGFQGELIGLDVPDALDGWKRAGGRDRFVYPAKGKAGDAAREALSALPEMPAHGELSQMLGCRGSVSYSGPDVSGKSGIVCLYPVQLVWDGDDIALIVADPEPVIADILARHPDVEIEDRWTVPVGLVEITKAQWTLVVANNAVAREAAA